MRNHNHVLNLAEEIKRGVAALAEVDQSTTTAKLFSKLLEGELSRTPKPRKMVLKSLLSELRTMARETMDKDRYARFCELLGAKSESDQQILRAVVERNRILSDEEFRQVLSAVDSTVQSKSMGSSKRKLVELVNQILARYEGQKKAGKAL